MQVLEKLYNMLINIDSSSLAVTINTKQFAKDNDMTDNELCRCLSYLNSAQYINCTQPGYVSEEKKVIMLTALAIDLSEQSS